MEAPVPALVRARLLFSALILVAFASAASAGTTAEQLVGLSRAGVSDDILITLIQSDGSTFQLSADDILKLHNGGLSDAVIRAMQATAKRTTPGSAPVNGDQQTKTEQQITTTTPAVVNVYQTVTQRVEPSSSAAVPVYQYPIFGMYTLPIAVPVYAAAPRPVVRPAPVYWGWGGQRRPDTWQEPVNRDK